MLRLIYLAIKSCLELGVPELEHIDYNLNQFLQVGEDHILVTAGAYIRFEPVRFKTVSAGVQRVDEFTFSVHLINETVFGDERDLIDTEYINQAATEEAVYKTLHGKTLMLSHVPGYEQLAGTEQDQVLLNSIERVRLDPHRELSGIVETVITFSGIAYDLTARKEFQTVLAQICVEPVINKM